KTSASSLLPMPAPACYVADLGWSASGFTSRSDIGPARGDSSAETLYEAPARRGEELDVDPEQFQDPDNEYGLFSGTTYEADDEEADKIYEEVYLAMDSCWHADRVADEEADCPSTPLCSSVYLTRT
ncbi:PRP1 splicing factor, N-terminal-domain-containing protein, partial [Lactarius quietus]